MARMLGVLAACSFFAFASIASADPSADIVGGSDADFNDWKFAAAILSDSDPASQFCGGALIRQQWVLTTKICVDEDYSPGAKYVMVGRPDLFGTGGAVLKVTDSFENPYFDEEEGQQNLALLRLESPAPAPAEPIQLPEPTDSMPYTGTIDVAGWGDTAGDFSGFPNALQAATMTLRAYCTPYGWDTSYLSFCAGSATDSDLSICFGDEGSPATYDFGLGKRLAGIANWSLDCNDPTYGSKFVDLATSETQEWINKTLSYSVRLAPAGIDFGNVALRGGTVTRTMTLKNVTDAPLEPGTAVAYYGNNGGLGGYNEARISRDGCHQVVLPVDGTCTVDLSFTPALLGPDEGEIVFSRNGFMMPTPQFKFKVNVVGDDRIGSTVFLRHQKLHRVKGSGKNAGRRYLQMIWTIQANGAYFGRGNPCSGTFSLSTKTNGVKRISKQTAPVGQIQYGKRSTVCGASFKVMLPKKKKGKKEQKKVSGKFTASYSGNSILFPSVGAHKLKVPLPK